MIARGVAFHAEAIRVSPKDTSSMPRDSLHPRAVKRIQTAQPSTTSSNSKSLNSRRTFVASAIPLSLVSLNQLCSSKPARALSPSEASKSYDSYASTYNRLDGGSIASTLGIDDARAELLGMKSGNGGQNTHLTGARGNVLEMGVGTGINLPYYYGGRERSLVSRLTCVDISGGMLEEAQKRNKELRSVDTGDVDIPFPVEFVQEDITSRSLFVKQDNTFDTIVDTFTFCVLGNEGTMRCLENMKRLVKDEQNGGKILLLENTKSDNKLLGIYQDITAKPAAKFGGKGCLYNQDVSSMIVESGLIIVEEISFGSAGLFKSFVCVKR